MFVELAVARYQNPDGSVNYSLHFADCADRIRQAFNELGSFEELCTVVRTTMTEWHKPRLKAPSNLEIRIRDEGDYPIEDRTLELSQEVTLLHFDIEEKRTLSFVAVTATADAVAV